MSSHRHLWKKHYGDIPRDVNGRSLEIHHINGDHHDNRIENLMLVSIEEHLRIHQERGDWGACVLISKRMGLSPTHCSDIQKGKKRPGVGGAKKGRIPWNKGVIGYSLKCDRKGKVCRPPKITQQEVLSIRQAYQDYQYHDEYEEYTLAPRKGGPLMSYEWFLAKRIQSTTLQSFTSQNIYNIIKRKSWPNV